MPKEPATEQREATRPERDEPVKIDLDPEEALRVLLRMPPKKPVKPRS